MLKKSISVILATLMLMSVLSITAFATGNFFSVIVENGYAEKAVFDDDGEEDWVAATTALAGDTIIITPDTTPEGKYFAGIEVNGVYEDSSTFEMPAEDVTVKCVFKNQGVYNIDLTGDGKFVGKDADRSILTSIIHYADVTGAIKSVSDGWDVNGDGRGDFTYNSAYVNGPMFKRAPKTNLTGIYSMVLYKSGLKYNLVFKLGSPSLNIKSKSIKAGNSFALKVNNGTVKKWTTNKSTVAGVTKSGVVYGFRKGKATITALTYSGKKLTCKVNVTTNPKLNKKKVTVKAKHSVKVKMTGKVSAVKNVYYNTKYAKITSKTTAKMLVVKGLQKGKTTLKIKVNGSYIIRLKVVVKK